MKRTVGLILSLSGLLLVTVIAGCGSGGPPPPPPFVNISITATTNLVLAGGTAGLTASATGDPANKGVTWSLSPASGAGSLSDTTPFSATYNAPAAPPPSDLNITITATSVTNPSDTAIVIITVPAITVALSASVNPVQACPTQPCPAGSSVITATVTNDPANKGVDPKSWTISPASGAGTLSGQTSTSVTYTAPSTPPASDVPVTITATSATDKTKQGSIQITFAAIAVLLLASSSDVQACPSLPCPLGMTIITATVSFDPANGGVNPASWAITSPSPAVGTLSNGTTTTVTYTAPSTPPASDVPVTITATSASDSTKSNTVTITFKAITVSIAPNPATVAEDTSPQFTATVNFDPSNGGVTWALSQSGVACSPACGTLLPANPPSTTSILYKAPGTVPTPNTVTLTATSVTDATKSGSSTITVVNPDSALNGHYAFLFHGFDDATGKQVAVAGSFTADGFGNITGGEEDINEPTGVNTLVTFTGGTYIVGLDNRGTLNFMNSLGNSVTYAFSLGSLNAGVSTKARLIEFDDKTGPPGPGTRGSGIMRLQDPTAFALAKITGSYGFGISGQDSSGGRLAAAGLFSADGAGNITGGTEDTNDAGTVANSVSFTGTYTAPDATNGRATGSITTTSPSQTTHFSLYVVSTSEAFLMTTDAEATSGLESGTVLSQASTPYSKTSLNAGSVFYEVGVNSVSPTTQSDVRIGLFTADGNGGLTITSDENDGGTITANSTTNGLTYSVAANGRVTITGGAGTSPILYLVDANKAFLLGADKSVGLGFLEPQTGAPFGLFSLSDTFFFGVAPPAVTASTVSSGIGVVSRSCRRFGFGFGFCFNTLRVTQDSSASNGTLTSGVATSSNFTVSANGRAINSGSVMYIISTSKFARIDEITTDVTPTVSIFEK